MSLSLSHWYPGSGVVLDCIDSLSLHSYLLSGYDCFFIEKKMIAVKINITSSLLKRALSFSDS